MAKSVAFGWKEADLIVDELHCDVRIAENLCDLFANDNTVTFIARYRREKHDSMAVDQLQGAFRIWQKAKNIRSRAETVIRQIDSQGNLNDVIKGSILNAKSIEQIDSLYVPFKPGAKRTFAEKARALGLEQPVELILAGKSCDLKMWCNRGEEGLSTLQEVELGVQHILADIIYRRSETQEFLLKICAEAKVVLEVKRKTISKPKKSEKSADDHNVTDLADKYKEYFDFKRPVAYVKPYQILAINRGENQNLLTVKLNIPEWARHQFANFVTRQLNCKVSPMWHNLLKKSTEDSYHRLAEPFLIRRTRSNLTSRAEMAAINVFACNLRQLLLTQPLRPCRPVLGIDPGFKHGCKTAVIDLSGEVLRTDTFFLPSSKHENALHSKASQILHNLLTISNVNLIAIGNGTGCRETETLVSECIKKNVFQAEYCIVSECGASIYSTSKVAEAELNDLDINLKSAVSIARRLQNPLAEYVKIEPKHLGVGMYQHDVNEKLLKETLDLIVEECVSFVGVDLNTCSQHLLQRVAGLNANRASKIIEYRKLNGRINSRMQLQNISGIGLKTFQQCAGFVRVYAPPDSLACFSCSSSSSKECADVDRDQRLIKESVGQKRKLTTMEKNSVNRKKAKLTANVNDHLWNPLDATMIHPESYAAAHRLLSEIGMSADRIGTEEMRQALQSMISSDLALLTSKLDIDQAGVRLIIDALQQPITYDYRQEFSKPLFRQFVRTLDEVQVGQSLSGQVRNVVDFGTFVDIGVSQDGLIHSSQMRHQQLQVGQRIEVEILQIDRARNRISLKLL